MKTIAKMAERLDMSAEEAVEVLRKLHFDIAGVQTEISDEQCDVLIEVDEDPDSLDRYLNDILKKEEQKKKRAERLQKAAQKVAAKRKAAAKKKEEKPEDEAPQESEPPEVPPEVTEPELEQAPEPAVAEEPMAEILPAEEKAPEPLATIMEEAAAVERAEIMEEVEPGAEGAAAEEAGAREVADASATILEATRTLERAPADARGGGLLAQAERRQDLEERRRAKQVKPLPKPDPAVVAEVIRRAQEKEQKKAKEKEREKRRETAPAAKAPKLPDLASLGDMELAERGKRVKAAKGGATGKTARKKQKRVDRARLEEDMRRDAAALVKEFQSGSFAAPKRKKKRKVHEDGGLFEEVEIPTLLEVEQSMTVEEFSNASGMAVNEIILELMDENILATKNHRLELDLIRKVAEKHGFEVRLVIPEEEAVMAEEADHPDDLELRPPVITVMGHVDHGKTSLLDMVRKSSVAAQETGGITQHIAAYDVMTNAGRLVFLDTPGHEAFTQMRARGAKVTDIVVLVVAADDGVQPQTVEAIHHARAAEVPIVVAINKCDKPDAKPDRVRQELSKYDLIDESWGGKTIMKEISAKTGAGVDDLMELLALQAESMDLKANPTKRARGTIVESEVSIGQGPVAWVLVQNGTLRVQDAFLAGETFGRVRTITTSAGAPLREVGPATPVLVTGFTEPPDAGDIFVVVSDERVARAIAAQRAEVRRHKQGPSVKRVTLEDFHLLTAGAKEKVLNIIVKADVQGSVDVLQSSFAKLGNEEVRLNIVHAGVGGINESDVLLASASQAVIIGFHVTAAARIQRFAEQEGVEIRTYRIIYEAIDEIHRALEGLLAPEKREVVTGHAEIRQVFRSSALGNIAGCYVTDGEFTRSSLLRLTRDSVVVYEGRINSLRRGKEDARSVQAGFECGIKIEGFDDIKEGDVIESFRIEEVAKTLN